MHDLCAVADDKHSPGSGLADVEEWTDVSTEQRTIKGLKEAYAPATLESTSRKRECGQVL
jgi:hypothetical protein